jgi:hypothetical protein
MIEYAIATETHASVANHLFSSSRENIAPPVHPRPVGRVLGEKLPIGGQAVASGYRIS